MSTDGQQQQQEQAAESPRPPTDKSKRSDNQSQKSQTPRSPRTAQTARGRHNKIYRTPPTPEPNVLHNKEVGFTLDSIACASISIDYSKVNPKLGRVIPPYNSQKDIHPRPYFSYHGVQGTLNKTGQHDGGTSMEGPVMDRFFTTGAGYRYLSLRNQFGAGHSTELIDGHGQFMSDIKPMNGYNGKYGYRRNTPWLRQMPSPFGTASTSPTH